MVAMLLVALTLMSSIIAAPSTAASSTEVISMSASAATTLGTVTITGSSVNVRVDAGVGNRIITSVKRNTSHPYTSTKMVSGVVWYNIIVGGKSGWVCGTYATVTSPASSTTSSSQNKVQITGSSVNVRKGAGTSNGILTVVYKNNVYTYSATKTVSGTIWYNISVGGKSGWVSGKYAKVVTTSSTPTASAPSTTTPTTPSSQPSLTATQNELTNKTRMFVSGSSVNMRKGPGTNYTVINCLPRNAIVYKLSTSGSWTKIMYNNTVGYMSSQYLSTSAVKANAYKTEGSISSSRKSYANTYMAKIPNNVWNAFVEQGWTLLMTTKDIRKTYSSYTSGSFAGLTKYGEKRCIIGYSESRIRRALLHEVGHFADHALGYPSYDSEFIAIYNAEKSKAKFQDQVDNHCYSSATEYFAEAFQQYLLYPSTLKSSAPRTYAYMQKYIPTI